MLVNSKWVYLHRCALISSLREYHSRLYTFWLIILTTCHSVVFSRLFCEGVQITGVYKGGGPPSLAQVEAHEPSTIRKGCIVPAADVRGS